MKKFNEFDEDDINDTDIKATIDGLKLDRDTDDESENKNEEGASGGEDLSQTQSQSDKRCCVCFSPNYSVLFLLCRHLCLCKDCYSTLKKNAQKKELRDAVNENIEDEHDNDLYDLFCIEYTIKCPLCNQPHKPDEILTDIYC